MLSPDALSRISQLDLRAKYIVEGLFSGLHRGAGHGFSSEFSEYRQHTAGEPSATIDWRIFARTGKRYKRLHQAETSLTVTLAVDVSASMAASPSLSAPGVRLNLMPKREYAAALAAALTWLLISQNDRVGLITFSDRLISDIHPSSKPSRVSDIMKQLVADSPGGRTDAGGCLEAILKRSPKRGMTVVISDFLCPLDGLERRLAAFRATGREVIAFCIHDYVERHPEPLQGARLRDPETGRSAVFDLSSSEYDRRMQAHIADLKAVCRRTQTALAVSTNRTPFDRLLIQFLATRNRRNG